MKRKWQKSIVYLRNKNYFIFVNCIFYITFFFVIACQQDTTKNNRRLILGEWRPITDYHMSGYIFMENGLCDYFPGFFSYFHSKGMVLDDFEMYCIDYRFPYYLSMGQSALNNVIRFYGNRTSYIITRDTLKIYDPSKNSWFKHQINFESTDSMVLSYINECQEEVHISFSRESYKLNDMPPIDQLIFFTPDGVLSKRIFSIQRNGFFVSYGYSGKDEIFVGKIYKKEFEHIENKFRRVDFNNLKPCGSYPFNHFAPKVAIICGKEMKIISAMTVIESNKEFYNAYISSLFIPYNIYLQPIDLKIFKENDFELETLNINFFESKESKIELMEIESFYLQQLLMTAVETLQEFVPIYSAYYRKKIKAETDGRYYRFTDKNGGFKTLDIGVNFPEEIKRVYINTPENNGFY